MDWFKKCKLTFSLTNSLQTSSIPLQDSTGSFKWVDNSEYNYKNWATGFVENNGQANKCALMESKSTFWNTDDCDQQKDFICKNKKGNLVIIFY